MLHTLSSSPWQCNINQMLRMINHKTDDVLLIQDGVLGAIKGSLFIKVFKKKLINIFALKEDIDARGIFNQISASVSIVQYVDFVDLVVKHTAQISW